MHALCGQHVSADQLGKRAQECRASADLIGERRRTEIDALAPVAFQLSVERLVLAILLEQHHGEQAWTGPGVIATAPSTGEGQMAWPSRSGPSHSSAQTRTSGQPGDSR
jgi:hypothetical protein